MKRLFIALTASLVIVLVALLLIPRPLLMEGIDFSQVVYDDSGCILRITLAKDGKYRLYTPLEQIPSTMIEATLLQEDHYFYSHLGINPIAVLKAAWQTYVVQTRQFGASTLTMQVARMRYNIPSKTVLGKVRQILKALHLELFYTKDEILEAYLNLAPYGGNIEGIGAASAIYFNKMPSQLNLAEALKLSVVPQNPCRRAPDRGSQSELHRAFSKLFYRWIHEHPEDQEHELLLNLPPQEAKRNLPFLTPHFVDGILKETRGQIIHTTINLDLQAIIEKVFRQYLEEKNDVGLHNGAALLLDGRTMEVKALIGSGDYFDKSLCGQINGTRVKRSPGSTLKPFIYALALDQGLIHPYTVLHDSPRHFGDYNPENFERDFLGPIRAKEALHLSRNIPAIFLTERLKNPTLYQLLQQAHVSRLKPEHTYGLSLALGSAEVTMEELVSLYAMLLNQGKWRPLRLTKEQPTAEGEKLLSPEASFLTLEMLKETSRPYVGNDLPFQVYWKTGTSSGYRDAWSVGIFGPYVLAVWLGHFNSQGHPSLIGTSAAAPLFFRIIEALAKVMGNLPNSVEISPDINLTEVEVCPASGLLATHCCPSTVKTWFIPGVSPIAADTVHREVAINSTTGLRTHRFDHNTQFVVYEFWPSDLLRMFSQAGIEKPTPPPFESESLWGDVEGIPPSIFSPQQGVIYTDKDKILFSAMAEGDVKMLYWFLNGQWMGCSPPNQPLSMQVASGSYQLRVVDSYGRTMTQQLIVEPIQ